MITPKADECCCKCKLDSLKDREIVAVMRENGSCRENDEADHIEFVRAVIALLKERK